MEYLVDNKELNCAIDLYTNGACFGSAAPTETYPAQKQARSCVDVSAYASLKANCSNAVLDEAAAPSSRRSPAAACSAKPSQVKRVYSES
ncbi:hypothetical protein F4809DRAFT_635360, partial [Biscogniauxia mediterranea]